MADTQSSDFCLGFPVDHRLKPLLGTRLPTPDPFVDLGRHARIIEKFGRDLQEDGENITDDEVKFAKWLAMPETKGGVVIVLRQPAKHQRYFSDPHQTVKDCVTLDAVDEVCKTITGRGIEEISCFDAFPFYKTPVDRDHLKELKKEQLDEAYGRFLDMIQQKQPDVVFCCYSSPYYTEYKEFKSIGVGSTRDYRVNFRGRRYTCVNGFHPSYALTRLEDESSLRSLFILEATQAFRRANGTWTEESSWKDDWMKKLRENCGRLHKIDTQDQENQPYWTRHDFQRERFLSRMGVITNVLDCFKSGTYDDKDNDELYHFVLENRYNVMFSNCLLVFIKVINFEDRGGARLLERGFEGLHQQEERDVRHLRRDVENECRNFLRRLCKDVPPRSAERGDIGLFAPADLNDSLLALGPFRHHSGFHSDFRLCLRSMVRTLNDAYTFRTRGSYRVDRDQIARALRLAAGQLEQAMAKHLASTQRQTLDEDLTISSRLQSLTINSSSQQTTNTTPTRSSQPSTSSYLSYLYAQSPPLTPPRRTTSTEIATPSRGSPSSATRPFRSPYRSISTCTECKESGHSSPSCPKTKCY